MITHQRLNSEHWPDSESWEEGKAKVSEEGEQPSGRGEETNRSAPNPYGLVYIHPTTSGTSLSLSRLLCDSLVQSDYLSLRRRSVCVHVYVRVCVRRYK